MNLEANPDFRLAFGTAFGLAFTYIACIGLLALVLGRERRLGRRRSSPRFFSPNPMDTLDGLGFIFTQSRRKGASAPVMALIYAIRLLLLLTLTAYVWTGSFFVSPDGRSHLGWKTASQILRRFLDQPFFPFQYFAILAVGICAYWSSLGWLYAGIAAERRKGADITAPPISSSFALVGFLFSKQARKGTTPLVERRVLVARLTLLVALALMAGWFAGLLRVL